MAEMAAEAIRARAIRILRPGRTRTAVPVTCTGAGCGGITARMAEAKGIVTRRAGLRGLRDRYGDRRHGRAMRRAGAACPLPWLGRAAPLVT